MLERYTKNFILTAGFPCQDASIAGKRAGLAGSQTGLFSELARCIAESKPEWFILENVPGLLSVNKGRDMAFIVAKLSEIGYCVAWRVLDAQYFGVAQRRRRLWIVGSFGDLRAFEVLFERIGSSRNDKAKSQVRERGLCISTRDGDRRDPTTETLIASVITATDYRRTPIGQFGNEENLVSQTLGATPRGNTTFVWQDTYIAETNAEREREIDGVSRKLYDTIESKILKEIINGKMGNTKSQSEKNIVVWQVLRKMWEQKEIAKTSSELYIRALRDIMPQMPRLSRPRSWFQAEEKDEKLYNLWQSFYALPQQKSQRLQSCLLEYFGANERKQKVASYDAPRGRGLGNSIVPQIARVLFEAIKEIERIKL